MAVSRVNALGEKSGKPVGRVVGVDLQVVDPIPGAEIHQLDFLDDGADDQVKAWLGGPADVVMSDMAASSSGHKGTDHLRIVALVEAAAQLAFDVLEPGGTFVAKVLAGGAEAEMQAMPGLAGARMLRPGYAVERRRQGRRKTGRILQPDGALRPVPA